MNSIFQVSSFPAALAISINKDNYTTPCIIKTGKFAISILSEHVKEKVIGTFGFHSRKEIETFEKVNYDTTDNGLPVLSSETYSYIECKVMNTVDCYTHTLIIAEIIDAKKLQEGTPLTYAYYHKAIKGKVPKKAPTYVEEEDTKAHTCNICGYSYPGSEEEFNACPF